MTVTVSTKACYYYTHTHTTPGTHTHTLTYTLVRTRNIPRPVYILSISKISDSSDGTRRPESQLPQDHPQRASGLSAKSFRSRTVPTLTGCSTPRALEVHYYDYYYTCYQYTHIPRYTNISAHTHTHTPTNCITTCNTPSRCSTPICLRCPVR